VEPKKAILPKALPNFNITDLKKKEKTEDEKPTNLNFTKVAPKSQEIQKKMKRKCLFLNQFTINKQNHFLHERLKKKTETPTKVEAVKEDEKKEKPKRGRPKKIPTDEEKPKKPKKKKKEDELNEEGEKPKKKEKKKRRIKNQKKEK